MGYVSVVYMYDRDRSRKGWVFFYLYTQDSIISACNYPVRDTFIYFPTFQLVLKNKQTD